MADLSDEIQQAAQDVALVEVDGLKVQATPISSLIEADKYLAGKAALTGTNSNGGPRSGWASLRPARATPPGAV